MPDRLELRRATLVVAAGPGRSTLAAGRWPMVACLCLAQHRRRVLGRDDVQVHAVDSSSPARWVRRGATSMRQQKCSAPRGAVRTHIFRGGEEPKWRASRVSPSCNSAEPSGPVVLEAHARHARREHQLEGQARAVGRHQHGLLVDRDDPLAAAHLFGDKILEQPAPIVRVA